MKEGKGFRIKRREKRRGTGGRMRKGLHKGKGRQGVKWIRVVNKVPKGKRGSEKKMVIGKGESGGLRE